MSLVQRRKLASFGAIVLAAALLSAVEIVFTLLVPKDSLVAILAGVVPLGIAVFAVLAGFESMLGKADSNHEFMPRSSLISMREVRLTGVIDEAYRSAEVVG